MSAITTVRDLFMAMFSSILGSNETAGIAVDALLSGGKPGTSPTFRTAAADAAANTATAAVLIAPIRGAGKVTGIFITANTTVAADATDFATITVSKYDAAGANKTTVATYSTAPSAQGALTAFVPKAGAVVAAAAALVDGGSLSYEVSKGGAGKQLPIFTIDLVVVPQ